jgi:hypothetical protein
VNESRATAGPDDTKERNNKTLPRSQTSRLSADLPGARHSRWHLTVVVRVLGACARMYLPSDATAVLLTFRLSLYTVT